MATAEPYGTSGETEANPPLTGLRLAVYLLILITNIVSTTVVSIALPMCLSGDVDMAVVRLLARACCRSCAVSGVIVTEHCLLKLL